MFISGKLKFEIWHLKCLIWNVLFWFYSFETLKSRRQAPGNDEEPHNKIFKFSDMNLISIKTWNPPTQQICHATGCAHVQHLICGCIASGIAHDCNGCHRSNNWICTRLRCVGKTFYNCLEHVPLVYVAIVDGHVHTCGLQTQTLWHKLISYDVYIMTYKYNTSKHTHMLRQAWCPCLLPRHHHHASRLHTWWVCMYAIFDAWSDFQSLHTTQKVATDRTVRCTPNEMCWEMAENLPQTFNSSM